MKERTRQAIIRTLMRGYEEGLEPSEVDNTVAGYFFRLVATGYVHGKRPVYAMIEKLRDGKPRKW